MSRMRLLLIALLLAATSCSTSLLKRDIQRQSDGWTLTFHEFLDGPNGFTARSGAGFVPPSGERYMWVVLSIRNDAATERQFNFQSCGLELGNDESLPLYVGLNIGTSAQVTATPDVAPGEQITRKLAFAYPKDRQPSRLTCFGNVIELRPA
jgi:hypothetical protein